MMLKGYERYVLSLEAKWYLKIPSTWKSTKMRTLFIERVIRVYNNEICDVIDNYNCSAFYEPSYVIARAYQNGGF